MVKTINMQVMRYVNLFEKISKVRADHCFMYNNNIIFVVPKALVSRAIGEDGKNVKKLNKILEKKAKVVAKPEKDEDAENFILSIVYPVKFKNFEVTDNEIIISAGHQSKAALIGRDRCRLEELNKIIKSYFNKELKIV